MTSGHPLHRLTINTRAVSFQVQDVVALEACWTLQLQFEQHSSGSPRPHAFAAVGLSSTTCDFVPTVKVLARADVLTVVLRPHSHSPATTLLVCGFSPGVNGAIAATSTRSTTSGSVARSDSYALKKAKTLASNPQADGSCCSGPATSVGEPSSARATSVACPSQSLPSNPEAFVATRATLASPLISSQYRQQMHPPQDLPQCHPLRRDRQAQLANQFCKGRAMTLISKGSNPNESRRLGF